MVRRAARRDAAHGLDLHLIGAGNSAGQARCSLRITPDKVTLVVRGDSLEKACRTI